MTHGSAFHVAPGIRVVARERRYLDSYDCVGKTVVLPGPVGARG